MQNTISKQNNWWQRIFKTSSLIGLSKIIGFARDLLIAAYFGTSASADAFNFAYLFTGNIFILLGGLNGPFHSATVATLGKIKNSSEKEQNIFLSNILGQAFLFFVFLSFILIFFLQPIASYLLPKDQNIVLAFIQQNYLMLPVLALTGVIGILFGAVSYRGNYFWPSLSPLISSLALIFCLYFGYKFLGQWILGLGTALGAILQTLIQIKDLYKHNFKFDFSNLSKGNLNYFYAILFPSLLSSTIGSLNVYVDSFFTAALQKGSWTAILLGNRLIQLPFGILVGASLISFLPRISSFKDDKQQFENTLNTEIQNLFFLMIPATALLFALSEPIIKLLFERGEFNSESTYLVNLVLLGLGGSLLTALPREVFTRAFYALGDSKTPLIVSLISIGLNAFFDWWLSQKLAVAGIALSTTITAAFNSLLIIFLLQNKIKKLKINWIQIVPFLFSGFLTYFLAKLVFFKSFVFLQNLALNSFGQLSLSCLSASLISLSFYFGVRKLIK